MAKGGARRGSGAKIIPMERKKVMGTYRADRDNTLDKPPINSELPVPPDRLSDRGKEIFNSYVAELERLKLASATFSSALASLAELEEEVEEYVLLLRKEGKTYTARAREGYDVLKARPEVAELRNARKMYIDLIKEFGLTPSSFARTGAIMPSEEKVDDEWQGFDVK